MADGPHEGLTARLHVAVATASRPSEGNRLLLHTSLEMPDFVQEGLPCYDDRGFYSGPLPSAQGYGGIFQRQATGPAIVVLLAPC